MPAMPTPPTKHNIVLRRGRTYSEVFRWETEPFLFAPILAIDKVAPVRVRTSVPHGLVNGWRVAVVDAKGVTDLNADNSPPLENDFRRATVVDPSTIEFNQLSGAGFSGTHRAGTGYLQWYSPHDLAGYVARMSIKNKVGGTVLLTSIPDLLTNFSGIEITLDDAYKTILVEVDPAVTEPITWKSGVYDLELESPMGEVTVILTGQVSVDQEITTPIL